MVTCGEISFMSEKWNVKFCSRYLHKLLLHLAWHYSWNWIWRLPGQLSLKKCKKIRMNGNVAPEYPIHIKSEQTNNAFPTPIATHFPLFFPSKKSFRLHTSHWIKILTIPCCSLMFKGRCSLTPYFIWFPKGWQLNIPKKLGHQR